MGIPKFFKWLTRRYPLILRNIQREEDCPPIGKLFTNQFYILDNLYLDLNGIVHNCIHGNDKSLHEKVSSLEDFDEVWVNIMKAIDEIVHTVKPKQLIFLAVDGVAPRAKMNQQRARRFRTAKDAQMLKQQLLEQGKQAPDLFDSNAISPGTKFMHELSTQLEFFVQYKLNTDPLYQNLPQGVILSDATVPGEGEHKMMDYIRQAKELPDYNPNTRHCFYGADADLIMLSLITHEPNFIIIREEHIVKKIKQGGVQRLDLQMTKNFQLIYISLMREYLQLEYSPLGAQMRMRFDLERIIDDFVFFCFFIGNDFLPSLSALDISEGSLDKLIDLYKKILPQMTNYITEGGLIYWDRAEPFIKMLGEHEHSAFKERIHSIEQARNDRIISFDSEFSSAVSKTLDRATIIKNKIMQKIKEKKLLKIQQFTLKNKNKYMKKFLLMKKFEDEEEEGVKISEHKKLQKHHLIEKYKAVRTTQRNQDSTQSEPDKTDDKQQIETLKDIISGIKEEYFSDLNVDDFDDDDVSDVSEGEIDITGIPELESNNQELESKIKVQQQIVDKYADENLEFMQEFIKHYAQDPQGAKAKYYLKKVHFDVTTEQGQKDKKKMLKKYIEGLQWVLFYYYKGVQHWRWYYPYHYAPMISDIDENIVENLLAGKITITEFDVDVNCSKINTPYTPFQQLLSILPIKSLHLLPDQYSQIVLGELQEYFPEEFHIDLNGRALPWEAIVLIPFCEEHLFIDSETRLLTNVPIVEADKHRNVIYFHYKKYIYDEELKKGPKTQLKSAIKKIHDLPTNYASMTLIDEYKNVGTHTFLAKIHPNVIQPCPDFPSFKHLNATQVEYDTKVINQVVFSRVLIKIPQCPEDSSSELFENAVYNFAKQEKKDMFIGFPWQFEAFPTIFEDNKNSFTLFGDVYTSVYKVHKEQQPLSEDKFDLFSKRQLYKLQDQGLWITHCDRWVQVNKVINMKYDSQYGYYKVYDQESLYVPMCMIMKKRDPNHYLSIDKKCLGLIHSFEENKQVVCLNQQLFGVVGTINQIDDIKQTIKVEFDKEKEESKIHDPFFGQILLLTQNMEDQQKHLKRFYTEQQIEQELRLKPGIISRITSSYLITFTDREKMERQVIDLGLNVKNFAKKVHIPDYVRFVVDSDLLADNYYDDYHHNAHARGYKQPRRHWEYSEECVEILREYHAKYRAVFDCIGRNSRDNKQVHSLKDIYGKLEQDEAAVKVKEIATWIESLPISHLPYVEMGFDALNEDLIQMLNMKLKDKKENCQSIQLKCRRFEYLKDFMLFQEHFPFWCEPFSNKQVTDYFVGDRVMNVNSTKREYIPFGIRGTVVGKTNEKVIVLFDEQFLNGNTIFGKCEDFKGANILPNNLINLTKKFNSLQKKNKELVDSFQEQPISQEEKEKLQQALSELQEKQEQQEQQNQQQQHHHHHHQHPSHRQVINRDQPEESKTEQHRNDAGEHHHHHGGQQPQQHDNKGSYRGAPGREYAQNPTRQFGGKYQGGQGRGQSHYQPRDQQQQQNYQPREQYQQQQQQYRPKNQQQQQQTQVYQEETKTSFQIDTSSQPFHRTVIETYKSEQTVIQPNPEILNDPNPIDEGDEPMPTIQPGFTSNPLLENNPDFQMLQQMLNLAQQLQAPLNLFNVGGVQQQQQQEQSQLDVNVPEFKPSNVRKNTEEEKKEQ